MEEMEEAEIKKENEGKTLYEYIGISKEKAELLQAKTKQIILLVLMGWIVGMVLDAYLGTNMYQTIITLLVLFGVVFKIYNSDNKKTQK